MARGVRTVTALFSGVGTTGDASADRKSALFSGVEAIRLFSTVGFSLWLIISSASRVACRYRLTEKPVLEYDDASS
jgi:hypothetical protein